MTLYEYETTFTSSYAANKKQVEKTLQTNSQKQGAAEMLKKAYMNQLSYFYCHR